MKQSRIAYRVLILIVFISINIAAIYGIAQIIHFLNTGADTSKIFNQDLLKEGYYTPKVGWNTSLLKGRPLENQTLYRIEKDYLSAWYARSIALSGESLQLL